MYSFNSEDNEDVQMINWLSARDMATLAGFCIQCTATLPRFIYQAWELLTGLLEVRRLERTDDPHCILHICYWRIAMKPPSTSEVDGRTVAGGKLVAKRGCI